MQSRTKSHRVQPRSRRTIVLQFEDVLMILDDTGVAATRNESSLNRNGRRQKSWRLAIANSLPKESRLINQMRIDDHRVADLQTILYAIAVERLFGKAQATRTITRRNGARK